MAHPDKEWEQLRRLYQASANRLVRAELLRILGSFPEGQAFGEPLAQQLQVIFTPEWIQSGDLAEVFAVLDALHCFKPNILDGVLTATLVKRLLASEADVGGPYRRAAGQSPDLLANAYIANCLAWMAAPLPGLSRFLEREVARHLRPQEAIVLARAHPWLVHTSVDPTEVEEPVQTALLLRAKYWSPAPPTPCPAVTPEATKVIQRAAAVYDTLPEPLRQTGKAALVRLQAADQSHEISLLAHYLASAFRLPVTKVAPELLRQFGTANIHSWLAYTIYDDFLDDEGKPFLLPVANVALRSADRTYRHILPDNFGFQSYAAAAFIAVDNANASEVAGWRATVSPKHITLKSLPAFYDGQSLAERALLHVVGPMGVLAAAGHTPGESIWKDTDRALRHYLIARQLNDDLHDWVSDLRNGRLTYVVTYILRHLSISSGVYVLDQLQAACQRCLWQQLLPELSSIIINHINLARQGLEPYVQANNRLFTFLDGLEDSIQQALTQQSQGQSFLRHLRSAGFG